MERQHHSKQCELREDKKNLRGVCLNKYGEWKRPPKRQESNKNSFRPLHVLVGMMNGWCYRQNAWWGLSVWVVSGPGQCVCVWRTRGQERSNNTTLHPTSLPSPTYKGTEGLNEGVHKAVGWIELLICLLCKNAIWEKKLKATRLGSI